MYKKQNLSLFLLSILQYAIFFNRTTKKKLRMPISAQSWSLATRHELVWGDICSGSFFVHVIFWENKILIFINIRVSYFDCSCPLTNLPGPALLLAVCKSRLWAWSLYCLSLWPALPTGMQWEASSDSQSLAKSGVVVAIINRITANSLYHSIFIMQTVPILTAGPQPTLNVGHPCHMIFLKREITQRWKVRICRNTSCLWWAWVMSVACVTRDISWLYRDCVTPPGNLPLP